MKSADTAQRAGFAPVDESAIAFVFFALMDLAARRGAHVVSEICRCSYLYRHGCALSNMWTYIFLSCSC